MSSTSLHPSVGHPDPFRLHRLFACALIAILLLPGLAAAGDGGSSAPLLASAETWRDAGTSGGTAGFVPPLDPEDLARRSLDAEKGENDSEIELDPEGLTAAPWAGWLEAVIARLLRPGETDDPADR